MRYDPDVVRTGIVKIALDELLLSHSQRAGLALRGRLDAHEIEAGDEEAYELLELLTVRLPEGLFLE